MQSAASARRRMAGVLGDHPDDSQASRAAASSSSGGPRFPLPSTSVPILRRMRRMHTALETQLYCTGLHSVGGGGGGVVDTGNRQG